MDPAATTGFIGALAAMALAGGVWAIGRKISESLRTINRSMVASSEVVYALKKNADSFAAIEKLLAGMIRLSEAQVAATLKLEATIAGMVGKRAERPAASAGSIDFEPDPDDASREFYLQQLERDGLTRDEATVVLDGGEPDGRDGLYAGLRKGLQN